MNVTDIPMTSSRFDLHAICWDIGLWYNSKVDVVLVIVGVWER